MNRVACCGMMAIVLCIGCKPQAALAPSKTTSLTQARQGHATRLSRRSKSEGGVETPPRDSDLRLEKYPSAVGPLPCYISADPEDFKKHPGIVWITGGVCNSI